MHLFTNRTMGGKIIEHNLQNFKFWHSVGYNQSSMSALSTDLKSMNVHIYSAYPQIHSHTYTRSRVQTHTPILGHT